MTLLRLLPAVCAALIAVLPAPTFAAEGGRTPKPAVTIANPDSKCVAPAEEMRKNHMVMLKHQRDRSLRQGIRGEPASLVGCVDCHASKKTGTVHGEGEFCQSCHAYAAVTLDCFQCHQPRAGQKNAQAAAGAKP
jgi:hypothetical protein